MLEGVWAESTPPAVNLEWGTVFPTKGNIQLPVLTAPDPPIFPNPSLEKMKPLRDTQTRGECVGVTLKRLRAG